MKIRGIEEAGEHRSIFKEKKNRIIFLLNPQQ
jgi:hypothetical protein